MIIRLFCERSLSSAFPDFDFEYAPTFRLVTKMFLLVYSCGMTVLFGVIIVQLEHRIRHIKRL
ncbi:MAG TPA: hypothetical protein PKH77_08730 [Anaerolineae bacterium]|nr:hypothetical protein [Anaerolineae bacterium]